MLYLPDHDKAEALWDRLTSEVIPVLDEEGVNVENGQMRRLPNGRFWLYVDDCNGYQVFRDEDARMILRYS